MLHKIMAILKTMRNHIVFSFAPMTVGELARWSKKPYSTVKRALEKAEASGLVEKEFRPYKSTGQWVYWITEKGFDWLADYREIV